MPETQPKNNLVLLAFDFGLRRLGIAVGQSLTKTAQPLTTLKCNNGEPDWHAVHQLQQEWQAQAFVVGLPKNKDGTDSSVSRAARVFAKKMEEQFGLPVYLVDERFSSLTAEQHLKEKRQDGTHSHRIKKEEIDKLAAAIILQSWFLESVTE